MRTAYLFLTSKVRLHCDCAINPYLFITGLPFPDLKGQAPLRQCVGVLHGEDLGELFLTSKVRLHCDAHAM